MLSYSSEQLGERIDLLQEASVGMSYITRMMGDLSIRDGMM